jgi:hypothetical protein
VSTALISKSLRNALREFLVGLTVREIRLAFEAAGVVADLEHLPTESGERRRLVEQHYHTLDFTAPADARRFVAACEESMAEAARLDQAGFGTDPRQLTRTRLLECLQRDGFRYEAGKIAPASPDARRILGVDTSMQSVSEITRRGIFDEFRSTGSAWCGRLSELEFLNRLYNLSALPSEDSRHKSMEGDVTQHRVRNRDWDDYWVFDDPRLNLLHSTDESFLRFLVQMVDPVVRQSASEVENLVSLINRHLRADHWELAVKGELSGRPVYTHRRLPASGVQLPESPETKDVLSDSYMRELADKCEKRLKDGDYDGAVTAGRTLLEEVLGQLEYMLTGQRVDHKGDLPKQFKSVSRRLRMDEQRSDLDERFKDVIRGLVQVVNGIAPLRNRMSDGHPRVRKPAAHHARLVVNAATTAASFLIESYVFQRDNGLLGTPSTEPKPAER